MDSSMGRSLCQASASPPGMIDGPRSAPSLPPETPMPTKRHAAPRARSSRRSVSVKRLLPASTTMSSASSSGSRASSTASTGEPAGTINTIRRGRSSAATRASVALTSRRSALRGDRPPVCASRRQLRLKIATRCPRLAKFRARFAPMTPRPTTARSHVVVRHRLRPSVPGLRGRSRSRARAGRVRGDGHLRPAAARGPMRLPSPVASRTAWRAVASIGRVRVIRSIGGFGLSGT